jgi:hydroxymethylpyrimidine pyrophosphatase-like HAD family hydrolase
MRYHALATDYDGTLANHGRVAPSTREALERLRGTGRKVILVTGREIEDLERVCPELGIFDLVVAENGGVLYAPSTRELRVLAEPPPPRFAAALLERGIPDVRSGKVVVATWQPHEGTVLDVIRELGLELQVVFNKGAVMVLPSGVNKGTGLRAALADLHLSPHNVVAVGDAENDHALLDGCACRVAVANAVPMLKERADLVTGAAEGAGVVELAARLIATDLVELGSEQARHDIPIGAALARPGAGAGGTVSLPAYGTTVLLTGTSGGGKSTFTTAFLERLGERGYQYCIFDPEGDYDELPGVIAFGGRHEPPSLEGLIKVLEEPKQNAMINMLGVGLSDRPALFEEFLPRLHLERLRLGHPHWIVIDEAHHLAPAGAKDGAGAGPGAGAGVPVAIGEMTNLFLVTVHPGHVAPALLARVNVVFAIGASPAATLAEFAAAVGVPAPQVDPGPLESGQAIAWWPYLPDRPVERFEGIAPATERRRHIRKYAEGEIPRESSFYFRGPAGKLNLRAQNLSAFLELGHGIDDETWDHHLRAGDYSRWLREIIKDPELAAEVAAVEEQARNPASRPERTGSSPARPSSDETRQAVRAAIEGRYTGPV